MIDNSIAAGLYRYDNVSETSSKGSINPGNGGDHTQHIFWWVERLPVPKQPKYVVINCDTNNINKNSLSEIANSILCIVLIF